MNYTFEMNKDVLIARIQAKRATVEFAGKFKEDLIKKIDESSNKVVVNLNQCEFVDSSFLGALVAGLKKATMKGGDLKIVGLQHPVQAMFELTRLYRIFDIFENEKDAVESF
ncbi:anti-anti-sigma factor [candidate division KSB1 bacterium]|jgi:anti-anti-sigma factor|nr:MAG: anti-anti-sigma factor [candidate division KSB1 bacterium]